MMFFRQLSVKTHHASWLNTSASIHGASFRHNAYKLEFDARSIGLAFYRQPPTRQYSNRNGELIDHVPLLVRTNQPASRLAHDYG